MLKHIRKLIRLLQVLEAWSGSRQFPASSESISDAEGEDPVVLTVVSRLSSLIRYAGPHLERYRAYAAKSASASHAARYRKSYSYYLGIYQSRLPALPKTVEI